jgi:hypothetical protein
MSRLGSLFEVLGRLVFGAAGGHVENPAYEGGEGIKTLWLSWEEMTYSGERTAIDTPSGVELSDLDRRLAAIFGQYFAQGGLNDAAVEELKPKRD